LNPIRFGSPGRQLFGLYQEPASSLNGCVVFCNPFGQEAIRSHRLFKVVADRVCRSGYAVLRFDYFGTGDSAGGDEEATLKGFVADLFTAHDEIVRRSGVTEMSWVGLRLGATVAVRAAAQLTAPLSRLVLWEPVIDGPRYLDELASAQSFAMEEAFGARCLIDQELRTLLAAEASHEALGFPITPTLRAEIEAIAPHEFGRAKAGRIDVFLPESAPGSAEAMAAAAFQSAININNAGLRATRITERIVWTADEMMNSATVPGEPLQQIANCFAVQS
jgi:uncharacterized protein